jgi:aminoglycoside phosphotransferase (APT) family kinase protein
VSVAEDPAGWALLTSPAIGDLLAAAVNHGGGVLRSWQVAEVDASPGSQTTATYRTSVTWPFGQRDELLGVSARVGGAAGSDADAVIFAAGDRQVAVWLYPRDPDLPGLARAAVREGVAAILTEHHVLTGPVTPDRIHLELIGYRPRRRAVLKATVQTGQEHEMFFLKALTPDAAAPTLRRHELLMSAGLPVPEVVAVTADRVVVLRQLPGRPLADAVFDPEPPCAAEALITLLDALPPATAELPRHAPWSAAVAQYAQSITAALPHLGPRLATLVAQITAGLAATDPGVEATHGDFHEGQLFTAGGQVVGLLDVDRVGPGRRADDLACMLAHLSTIQGMSAEQAARLAQLIKNWRLVFEQRVEAGELRLRAAAVTVSLATGPYRTQRPGWQQETTMIVDVAERMVASIA